MEPLRSLRTFPWDGSDLGEVVPAIREYQRGEEFVLLTFHNGEQAYANQYKNGIPLVADELKPLFGLAKIGRHKCRINGSPAIISRFLAGDTDGSAISSEWKRAVQSAYLFRWALGLTVNNDQCLYVRGAQVTSFRELKYDYFKEKLRGSWIPVRTLQRWFGDWERLHAFITSQFGYHNLMTFRFNIEKTIRRVDPELVGWAGLIIRRISEKI